MRTPSCEMKMGLKKGPWSGEEDHKLISYISRYGIWNWSHMPKFAGLSRSGKSCRLRWMNYLRPDVKKGNFTKEEEDIIIHSHSLLGNRWSAIASRLPGRTDNDIKNYWHTHLKKRGTRNLASETTKPNDSTSSPYVNHETDISESQSSLASEEDNSSSTCSNFSFDKMLDFKDDCYNIGSPGTADDLYCFWNQLCTIENLELGSNHQHLFSGSVLQDAFDESISLYGFYNCQ